MPEQASQRGHVVTKGQIEAAFETQIVRLGVEGLNLKDAVDTLRPGQLSRMTNVVHDTNGVLTARPGLTDLATSGGTSVHSVRKFRDPASGTFTRIWGIDTGVYLAASGAVGAAIDTGYSGNPLTFVPHRPPLSGDPWLFVADTAKMRKIRADGLVLPIGLAAPSAAPTAALATEQRTSICNFDNDGSQPANWVGTPGSTYDEEPFSTGTPQAGPVGASPGGALSLGLDTVLSTPTSAGYNSMWGVPLARNLSLTGAVAASDDDYFHIWMEWSHPGSIQEMRLYFVCSTVFDVAVLPGTSSTANIDAYVKTFSVNDFASFVQGQLSQIDAAEVARIRTARENDLIRRASVRDEGDRTTETKSKRWSYFENSKTKRSRTTGLTTARTKTLEQVEVERTIGVQAIYMADIWQEFGVVGLPVRRGDFQRIGNTTGRDWSTVTGIVVWVKVGPNSDVIVLRLSDLYLTGGSGPDTGEPGMQSYDYRTTHYDPRTGAEGNLSPEMAEANLVDSLRRSITVTPQAHADSAIRQRIYRRGGTLFNDWYFVGTNSSNGGAFTDSLNDDEIVVAGTPPTDHFQAVPTVNDTGATVLAQPLSSLWGPVEGMLFGCGDPYRPGHLYFSLPDAPDHWSASGNVEVCPPSEELLGGGVMGHQPFVFSRLRLHAIYPNLTGVAGSVSTAPTLCQRGTRTRWSFTVGPGGIYFLDHDADGIFRTSGGPEEWLSRDVDPLFHGESVNGYLPINKDALTAFRLSIWEHQLFFGYEDTGGTRQVLVYHFLTKVWRHANFHYPQAALQGDDEDILVIGSNTVGSAYTHEGFSDDGAAITCTARTGTYSGDRREEKLLGDQIIEADVQGTVVTVTNYLNEEAHTNTPLDLENASGRNRYILDGFGEEPQRARSISTGITWSSAIAAPLIYQLGYGLILQPEITAKRVTDWDDLGHPDEKWLTGVTFDVDTANIARTILIERDYHGSRTIVDTLTVQANGRHKVGPFSWLGVPAHQVRVRPNDDCKFWVLYRVDWIWQNEPPRLAKWDIHWENGWDQYYTGLDLHCDTSGIEKTVVVEVDGVALVNPATGLSTFPVSAQGRKVVHLTLPWGRGHVFRFYATDVNPGQLYAHRWHLQEEPSEQANWNQNFSIYGTRADKYLKAVVFECDTFGANKSVTVEADGVVVETLTVRTHGRKVVQIALSEQKLGRVWRLFPTDSSPARLYSAQPVFDEEPFQLDRWETQETNHGLPGWFQLLWGHVTLKSTAEVTLTIILHHNQRGGTTTKTYPIEQTDGLKQRRFVTFESGKGVLVKYLLTSSAPFHLYQEETVLFVQPWGQPQSIEVHPFGNSDVDPTRNMVHAEIAAARSGGSA